MANSLLHRRQAQIGIQSQEKDHQIAIPAIIILVFKGMGGLLSEMNSKMTDSFSQLFVPDLQQIVKY